MGCSGKGESQGQQATFAGGLDCQVEAPLTCSLACACQARDCEATGKEAKGPEKGAMWRLEGRQALLAGTRKGDVFICPPKALAPKTKIANGA